MTLPEIGPCIHDDNAHETILGKPIYTWLEKRKEPTRRQPHDPYVDA